MGAICGRPKSADPPAAAAADAGPRSSIPEIPTPPASPTTSYRRGRSEGSIQDEGGDSPETTATVPSASAGSAVASAASATGAVNKNVRASPSDEPLTSHPLSSSASAVPDSHPLSAESATLLAAALQRTLTSSTNNTEYYWTGSESDSDCGVSEEEIHAGIAEASLVPPLA